MKFLESYYLPSGRVFLLEADDGYPVECTEMRDVSVGGKEHWEVRNSQDPHVIWRHLKPYEEKWLLTVSTQKGCCHSCRMCDVPGLPFKGNLAQAEIEEQVRSVLAYTPYVTESEKVKIGFARMGEPGHNLDAVLGAMRNLPAISAEMGRDFSWLPCFNSILPRKTIEGRSGEDIVRAVLDTKERDFAGRLHFQVSCNSTDEGERRRLFGGADVLTLEEVIGLVNDYPAITARTVTLNFIVMRGVPVSVERLVELGLGGDRFAVKLIPLNRTERSADCGLETLANYENYEDLVSLGRQFNEAGVPTVIDAIAKCEEAGLCCGQLAHVFAGREPSQE